MAPWRELAAPYAAKIACVRSSTKTRPQTRVPKYPGLRQALRFLARDTSLVTNYGPVVTSVGHVFVTVVSAAVICAGVGTFVVPFGTAGNAASHVFLRSEERRVGEEC